MRKKQISDLIVSEFSNSLLEEYLYLNHAAISPWPKRTKDAVCDFAEENFHHGAICYKTWLQQERQLKKQIKDLINAPTIDEIALLKNTSEALSVVAEGIHWKMGDNIVGMSEDFPSNRVPWEAQAKHGVEYRAIPLDGNSPEPENALINACDEHTRLLAISSVHYASGLRLNLEKLGEYCHRHDILFCIDSIQSLGIATMDVQAIKADFIMADAHKWLLAPEGIAIFYCRHNLLEELQLHQYGWHMLADHQNYDKKDWQLALSARRFECGSPNTLGIYALSASLSLLLEIGIETISRLLINKIDYLFDNIININGISIQTPIEFSKRAGILTFQIHRIDMPKFHRNLLKNKLICAYRGGGIRLSPHFYTHQKILDKAINIIKSTN